MGRKPKEVQETPETQEVLEMPDKKQKFVSVVANVTVPSFEAIGFRGSLKAGERVELPENVAEMLSKRVNSDRIAYVSFVKDVK